ncbi:MAG: sigma-70 family RNA polymerase sigma factor, partial [Negativicutes bacterium]|nr:sigma-70 family RNA polymerase sigma factor [Negativicutes bacterium]
YYRRLRDEVEGECWLALIEAIRDYNPESGVDFAGFVRSRVKWAAWRAVRGQRRWLDCRIWAEGVAVTTVDERAERELAGVDDRDLIDRLLAGLTPRQREVLKLMVVDGYRNGEVAEKLAVSPATVSRLYRAGLNRLRKLDITRL